MTPRDLEQVLRQTLIDHRLSGPERLALAEVLATARQDTQSVGVYRNLAFKLAREEVADPGASKILDWLEDVVKLLHPVKSPASASSESSVLFAPEDDLCSAICRLFDRARRTVDVCVFTITDDRVTDAILRAHRRGIVVRIIADNDKALDLGSDIDRLSDAGIVVRLDRTEAHMHHKFALFDRETLANGSYNWTRSAAERNNENCVISSEEQLTEAFARQFDRLWRDLA